MTSKLEVRLSESVLTLVTHSAYETGGGFNLVPGGVQCSSANLTDAQRAIVREERKERREKTTWYSPNLQQESTRFLNEKKTESRRCNTRLTRLRPQDDGSRQRPTSSRGESPSGVPWAAAVAAKLL